VASGSITLEQVAAHTALRAVACSRCDRAGRYNLNTLIAPHGPAFGIPELLRLLSGDCPKRQSVSAYDLCGVHCLGEVSTQVTAGARALLVCDGAGWHQRGRQLVVSDNIGILTLPAYSPKLNPMENVWDYLRQNKLCSRIWDTYEDIVEACKQAWHFLIDYPDRIRSLGQRSWACVNV
jgi:hypothetical protein